MCPFVPRAKFVRTEDVDISLVQQCRGVCCCGSDRFGPNCFRPTPREASTALGQSHFRPMPLEQVRLVNKC